MLVIAGRIVIDPAKQGEASAAARTLMEETRKESGCISYTFSADLSDAGLFHIFEEWESQEALDAHFKAPHMAQFQKLVPTLGLKEMKVKRYEVASVGPVR